MLSLKLFIYKYAPASYPLFKRLFLQNYRRVVGGDVTFVAELWFAFALGKNLQNLLRLYLLN